MADGYTYYLVKSYKLKLSLSFVAASANMQLNKAKVSLLKKSSPYWKNFNGSS